MPTTQSQLPPPNTVASNLSKGDYFWLTQVQNQHPLITVDTSAGSFSEAAPPAGLESSTGQTNQNVEITYKKITDDLNVFTLTGVEDGPLILRRFGDVFKIKSDGTVWWKSA